MATVGYSSLYSTATATSASPIQGRPKSSNIGENSDSVAVSLGTTNLDTLNDFYYAIPVRSGKTIEWLDLGEFTDMDTGAGALDMDIILRTLSATGTATDTILFNAGTFFAAAQTAGAIYRVWCRTKVPDCATGVGHIGFLVNVAASTPNAGTGQLAAKVI